MQSNKGNNIFNTENGMYKDVAIALFAFSSTLGAFSQFLSFQNLNPVLKISVVIQLAVMPVLTVITVMAIVRKLRDKNEE